MVKDMSSDNKILNNNIINIYKNNNWSLSVPGYYSGKKIHKDRPRHIRTHREINI